MKVLRLTRHTATAAQTAELRRIYGDDVVVTEISETVPGAARVTELVREHGAEGLEAVLPLPILGEVVGPRGCGVPVIRAVMRRELVEDQATFTFSHYEKIVRVEVVTERL